MLKSWLLVVCNVIKQIIYQINHNFSTKPFPHSQEFAVYTQASDLQWTYTSRDLTRATTFNKLCTKADAMPLFCSVPFYFSLRSNTLFILGNFSPELYFGNLPFASQNVTSLCPHRRWKSMWREAVIFLHSSLDHSLKIRKRPRESWKYESLI